MTDAIFPCIVNEKNLDRNINHFSLLHFLQSNIYFILSNMNLNQELPCKLYFINHYLKAPQITPIFDQKQNCFDFDIY